jgi:hypothetical protein
MSSIDRAEALVRLLDDDHAFSATRPVGYAYARTVDVEHPEDQSPDQLVRALDPFVRVEGDWPDAWPDSAPESVTASWSGDDPHEGPAST